MLSPGSPAPDFALPDDTGTDRTLADLTRDGPAVLYFYPADFTPVCTREACAFRDVHPRLVGAGIALVGISPQGPATHAKFRERFALPFPLLADRDRAVIRAYDATGPFGLGVARITYLVGADRTIKDAVRADFRVARHARFVEHALAEAEPASS